jgi:Flp pilus assembly protein TadG
MNAARRMKGLAAIELGLLLVPLVVMFMGAAELGRAFHYYNGLLKSAREASRYVSQHSGAGPLADAQGRCLAVYGDVGTDGDGACTATQPRVPGLTSGMVAVDHASVAAPGKGSIDVVTVTITGVPFTPIVWPAASLTQFGAIASTMREG